MLVCVRKPGRASLVSWLRHKAHKAQWFIHDEYGGGLIVFSLFMLFLMLATAGIAVDTMRFETERTRLQNTTDAAVLAAASLSQVRDPQDVVEDYFAKAGLSDSLQGVEVDEGLNYREVRVMAQLPMRTILMRLAGVDQLSVPSLARAEERVNNVEVSLVVDLSGSMQGQRIANLKDASNDFVDTLLGEENDGQVSISLVPYTGQVNAGGSILSQFSVAHRQGYSHCVDFDAMDYRTTAMSPMQTLTGHGHSMPYVGYAGTGGHPPAYFSCPVAPGNAGLEVVPFESDPDLLRDRIDGMQALGATSIDIGMKWGTALLDPSVRPVVQGLIADGIVAPEYNERPHEYDDPDVMKVVVLMTDGDNFPEYRLMDSFKSGPSNVWVNEEDTSSDTYSLYSPNIDRYWWARDRSWHDQPYGYEGGQTCETQQVCTWSWRGRCYRWEEQQVCTPTGESVARRLDYPELLNRATVDWVRSNLYGRAGINPGSFTHSIPAWRKDERLQDICAAAREAGIIVFTVAFEAPANGRAQLRQCASSASHYFDVSGLDIRTAFRAIALQISQLRLTE